MLTENVKEQNVIYQITARDLEEYSVNLICRVLDNIGKTDVRLRPKEAAELLDCSITSLWRKDKAGITHPIKTGGKSYYDFNEIMKVRDGEVG